MANIAPQMPPKTGIQRESRRGVSVPNTGSINGVHHLTGAVVFDEQLAIALEGAFAHFTGARFEIESKLHIGAEEIGLDGLGDGPVLELLQEEQAGDGIEFLGGSAHDGVEVFGEAADGHQLEQGLAKDALPAGVNPLAAERGNDAVVGVKQATLLWINTVAHISITPCRIAGYDRHQRRLWPQKRPKLAPVLELCYKLLLSVTSNSSNRRKHLPRVTCHLS